MINRIDDIRQRLADDSHITGTVTAATGLEAAVARGDYTGAVTEYDKLSAIARQAQDDVAHLLSAMTVARDDAEELESILSETRRQLAEERDARLAVIAANEARRERAATHS